MKAKPTENPLSDCQYEYENGQFTMSGPLHYENDVHPSISPLRAKSSRLLR
jgi:hypothetical protein